MSYGAAKNERDEMRRRSGSWLFWRLVLWIGGGTVALFALLVLALAIFAGIAVYLGGGMPGLKGAPQVGTAATRPTMWLDQPAIVHSSLPNVVIAAVMEHESQGQVFARNYNCNLFGLTSPIPCSQTFPGGLIKTKSEDAGLMQVNSANWKQYGLTADPFNPQKNIAAGVAILEADYAKYGYLEYALEAYNSGSGGPDSPDVAYAQAVLADINAYEAGPVVSAWATLPPGQAVQGVNPGGSVTQVPTYVVASQSQSYWVIVAGMGPYGAPITSTWNPPPITVTTKAGKVTTIPQKPVQLAGIPWAPRPAKCVTDKKGTTTCTPQPPVMVAGRMLTSPESISTYDINIGSSSGNGAPLQPSPGQAPVWPGSTAWATQTSGSGQVVATASWGPHQSSDISIFVLLPGQSP